MIRPAAFGFNTETQDSNRFQRRGDAGNECRARAVGEFDALLCALREAGVAACALDDRPEPPCPDAVFPNNWVSFHADGTVVLYPMLAPSRRRERRMDLLAGLREREGFEVSRLLDLTHHELAGRYLEGTGSVVFDHVERVAYACRSPRTDVLVLQELCAELGYEPCVFTATDRSGVAVYHTNVMLAVGHRFVVVCAEAVADGDRPRLLERLAGGGRAVLPIDRRQMTDFAGNLLELRSRAGRSVLAVSARALASLEGPTSETLRRAVDRVVAAHLPTIEAIGGGSVRCMLAEVFLPRRE